MKRILLGLALTLLNQNVGLSSDELAGFDGLHCSYTNTNRPALGLLAATIQITRTGENTHAFAIKESQFIPWSTDPRPVSEYTLEGVTEVSEQQDAILLKDEETQRTKIHLQLEDPSTALWVNRGVKLDCSLEQQ